MRDDSFGVVLDAASVTPAMQQRRSALSARAIEPVEEAPADAADFTADIAPFAGGGWRPPSVSRRALEADGLAERPTEQPLEIPEEWRDRKILNPNLSPHNPLLSAEERRRNLMLLERGFEIEPDEEEEKPAPAPAQRRVVLTAAMVGQMTDDEVDEWIERHS